MGGAFVPFHRTCGACAAEMGWSSYPGSIFAGWQCCGEPDRARNRTRLGGSARPMSKRKVAKVAKVAKVQRTAAAAPRRTRLKGSRPRVARTGAHMPRASHGLGHTDQV